MSDELPFRTDPKRIPLQEEGLLAEERPDFQQGPEALLERIRNTRLGRRSWHQDAWGPLQQWLAHPDERVVLAVLDKVDREQQTHSHPKIATPKVWRRFRERALRQAWKEGLHWTPMLDRYMSCEIYYSEKRGEGQCLEEEIGAQLEKLGDWIGSCQDPGELSQLLSFKSKHVYARICRHARVFNRELLRRLVGRLRGVSKEEAFLYRDPHSLAENHHLEFGDILDLHEILSDDADRVREPALMAFLDHPAVKKERTTFIRLLIEEQEIQLPTHIETLAGQKAVRNSPELRKLLVRRGPYRAFQALLRDPGDDLVDLIEIVARDKEKPRRVLSDLKRNFRDVQEHLEPRDLQPLLEVEDGFVRREAMRLMGQLDGRPVSRDDPEFASQVKSR